MPFGATEEIKRTGHVCICEVLSEHTELYGEKNLNITAIYRRAIIMTLFQLRDASNSQDMRAVKPVS